VNRTNSATPRGKRSIAAYTKPVENEILRVWILVFPRSRPRSRIISGSVASETKHQPTAGIACVNPRTSMPPRTAPAIPAADTAPKTRFAVRTSKSSPSRAQKRTLIAVA
jgi:hypothetical protein